MSIPVSFLNVPETIMESAYFATDKSKSRKNGNGALVPLSFPQSNVALWDPTPQGKPVCLHMAQFRNPRLLILEKTLRLAHRHANQFGGKPQSAFLIGSLAIDNDEEGITVSVDRFDPGRETPGAPGTVMPTALLPGDFLISMCVGPVRAGSDKTAMHSRDDFLAAFKSLHQLASSREASDPGRLLLARAVLEGAPSGPGALALSLSLAAVVVARAVLATPVRPLPIIPTALARNLAGPASIARVQAACKSGFLTMDQTRKLLLILESDPKAQSLPLVGIWVSGVMHVANPHVWACCLRFFFGTFIRQRLLAEGSRCLLLIYTLTHSEPEFYECSLDSGQGLDFNLYSCSETLHVFKDVEAAERPPVQLELAPDRRCGEWGCFKGALGSAPGLGVGEGPASPGQRSLPSDNDSGLEEEDFSPRPTPSPHPNTQLSPKVHPCVPELSLVCDGTFLPAPKGPPPRPPPSSGNDENRAPADRVRPAKRVGDRHSKIPLAYNHGSPPTSRADATVDRSPPLIRQPLMPKNQQQQPDPGSGRSPVNSAPVTTAAWRPLSQTSPGPVLCPLARGGSGSSGSLQQRAHSPDVSFLQRCAGTTAAGMVPSRRQPSPVPRRPQQEAPQQVPYLSSSSSPLSQQQQHQLQQQQQQQHQLQQQQQQQHQLQQQQQQHQQQQQQHQLQQQQQQLQQQQPQQHQQKHQQHHNQQQHQQKQQQQNPQQQKHRQQQQNQQQQQQNPQQQQQQNPQQQQQQNPQQQQQQQQNPQQQQQQQPNPHQHQQPQQQQQNSQLQQQEKQQQHRQQQQNKQHWQNPQQQQPQQQQASSHYHRYRQSRSPAHFHGETPHSANFVPSWPCHHMQRAKEHCCCSQRDGGSGGIAGACGGGNVGTAAMGAGHPGHVGWLGSPPPLLAGAAYGLQQDPPGGVGCLHAVPGLSGDAYCLLMEQDRQLKLLQAQIQKLLAAQICNGGSKRDEDLVPAWSSPSSPGPAPSESKRAAGTQKQAVSIACETGGSLIWGPGGGGEAAGQTQRGDTGTSGTTPSGDGATDGHDVDDGGAREIRQGVVRDDGELALSGEDEGAVAQAVAAVIEAAAACDASVASSLRAVDLPSFVESRGSADDSSRSSSQDSSPMGPTHHAGQGSPALGESASIYIRAEQEGGGAGGGVGAATGTPEVASAAEQADGESNSLLMRDEKQFYHNLLHQVNRLLTNTAETPGEESATSDREERPPAVKPCPGLAMEAEPTRGDAVHGVTSRRKKAEDNSVVTATLKQLRKMGVRLDGEGMECAVSGGSATKHSEQAERASTLARILPTAAALALPHFSYSSLSFAIGASGFSGDPGMSVDLSMEANAIALKYLSDAQLAQLSRGGGSSGSGFGSGRAAEVARASLAASLSDSDRSTTLGLLSPSNMSFATRRYMQKYGLIDGGISDDDDDDDDDDRDRNQVGAARREDLVGARVPAEDVDTVSDTAKSLPSTAGSSSQTPGSDFAACMEHGSGGARLCERLSARRNSEPSLVAVAETAAAAAAAAGSRRSTGEGRAFTDAAGLRDNSTVQVLKGLTQPQRKLLSTGHAVFTRHPLRVLPERKKVLGGGVGGVVDGAGGTGRGDSPEKIRGNDRDESMGNILDIERLRQLPKLF